MSVVKLKASGRIYKEQLIPHLIRGAYQPKLPRLTSVSIDTHGVTSVVVSLCTMVDIENAMDKILSVNYGSTAVGDSFVEGDIVPDQQSGNRNAARDRNLLWPNGIVFYNINTDLSTNAGTAIQNAINDFHMMTCVRFQQRTTETDYIEFVKENGCSSRVGRSGGKQVLSVDGGCEHKGTVIHEMMHAIGFWHEHSRNDRDDYVIVNLNNVIVGKERNFDKYDQNIVDTLGVDYDYRSIMHYSNVTFSKNTLLLPTIQPKQDIDVVLGQRVGFSDLDLVKVNKLYNCGIICPPLEAPTHGALLGDCCLKGDIAIFTCELGYTLYGEEELQCLDTGNWNYGTPVCQETTTLLCDLSDGLCGFTQDMNDNFDWVLHWGSTPSAYTGPTIDHTTGTNKGKYLYIESSSPRVEGDKALLVSPIYPDKSKCLRFYYHMYGEHVGTINVYMRAEALFGTSSLGELIFSLTGEQVNMWKLAEIEVRPDSPFQIVFEGIRGVSYRGDFAIDDISARDGSCLPQGSPFVCDFESGPCDFQQDQSDDFDWTLLKSGPTLTANTGPIADHTLSDTSGHYIYIESSNTSNGNKARIVSPSFSATNGSCLTFYYHMYGSHMGTLNMYIYNDGDVMGSPVWSTSGDKGNQWNSLMVYLVRQSHFKVTFEGVKGNSYLSDIALDDIGLRRGNCQY
ncbi:meprin A subunit beta-like [Saccoglossus kowalevskii]